MLFQLGHLGFGKLDPIEAEYRINELLPVIDPIALDQIVRIDETDYGFKISQVFLVVDVLNYRNFLKCVFFFVFQFQDIIFSLYCLTAVLSTKITS